MFKQLTKQILKKLGNQLGLYIVNKKDIPFGVNWLDDVAVYFRAYQQEVKLVFDVGANIGQTALLVNQHFSRAIIYSFEPIPSSYLELINSTKKFPNIKAYNLALGQEVDELYMTNNPLCQGNKIVEPNNRNDLIKVKVESIDNFCAQNKIETISILKIDVEGFELSVLKGAQQMLREHRIDFIYAECSLRNEGIHGNFWEIYNYLQQLSYNLVTIYTAGVSHSGMCYGNALFIKADSNYRPFKTCASPYRQIIWR